MTFTEFKRGPALSIFERMGLQAVLKKSRTWRDLRRVLFDDGDKFIAAVRTCNRNASSGERVLLHAILYATGFGWFADKLTMGRAWRRMDEVRGDLRRSVAACIAAED
jgi:hypothetical protein